MESLSLVTTDTYRSTQFAPNGVWNTTQPYKDNKGF